MKKLLTCSLLVIAAFSVTAFAQAKYDYAAQKNLIPKDLGKVYLGMPLKDFAAVIPLSKAETDGRFDYLELKIPFEKGNIVSLRIRAYGLSQAEKQEMVFEETSEYRDEYGVEHDKTIERIDVTKIPAGAFVYSMYVDFKPTFALKPYVIKTYGNGEVRSLDDEYHFFDIEWTKKTSDGLQWLIRSFHEGDSRSLQLLGRINGTEWELEETDN